MIREYLLFVRTKTAVHLPHEQDMLSCIVDVLPDNADVYQRLDRYNLHWLSFGKGQEAWENGAALRLRAFQDIGEIARDVGHALQDDPSVTAPDGVLICDRMGPMLEIPSSGAAERFCGAIGYEGYLTLDDVPGAPVAPSVKHISLIALTYHPHGHRAEDDVAALRASLAAPCYPLLHLRNGQVMAMASDEPASITSRRSARHFGRFGHWAVFDAHGSTSASAGLDEAVWLPVDTEEYEEAC